jgi:hypothetical protein
MNRVRRYRLPRRLMPPRIVRSPVEICFRHEPKPSGKVAALSEGRTVADRRHHRACRHRPDTRNGHKALAVLVLFREFLAQYLARSLPYERFTAAVASNISCITRGRGGWLDLPRGGLPPPILCQLPGALRDGSTAADQRCPCNVGLISDTGRIVTMRRTSRRARKETSDGGRFQRSESRWRAGNDMIGSTTCWRAPAWHQSR